MPTLSRHVISLIVGIIATCVLGFVVPASATDSGFSTPRVRVSPAGQHGFPYGSSSLNLAALGYSEQEYLISGTARAFIPTAPLQANGRWSVKPNPGITAPYTTRIIVRRPINPTRFSGTVVVEWDNASGGDDVNSDWYYMHEEIVRQGYVYVGVTTQYRSVQTDIAWESGSASRYASLFHPGESYDYDIFSQAGWVTTHARNGDPRPLGDLTDRVRAVIATGFSQSAAWLTTYVNAIHRLNPVYAGFLIHDHGSDAPLSLDVADFAGDPIPGNVPVTPFIDTPYPMQLRNDQNVPVLVTLSEFGLSDFGTAAARTFHLQPDSAHIRVWEFTGAPHIDGGFVKDITADAAKTDGSSTVDPCDGPPGIGIIVTGQGTRASLTALSRWANGAEAPRSAPRMSLVVPNPPDSFEESVTFNRDPATGIAIGGIRLPAVAVPTATLNGNRSDLDELTWGPGGQCYLVGAYDPWNHDSDLWDGQAGLDPSPTPEPDLQVLYPSHQSYVERVAAAALQSVKDGYLRPADGVNLVLDAAHAAVP
jgi:hypothetical protein